MCIRVGLRSECCVENHVHAMHFGLWRVLFACHAFVELSFLASSVSFIIKTGSKLELRHKKHDIASN